MEEIMEQGTEKTSKNYQQTILDKHHNWLIVVSTPEIFAQKLVISVLETICNFRLQLDWLHENFLLSEGTTRQLQ